MIKLLQNPTSYDEVLNRDVLSFSDEYEDTVKAIVREVRDKKDEALLAFEEKFDRVRLEALEVTKEEIEAAAERVSPSLKKTLEMAKANITYFHKAQKHLGFELQKQGGIVLGQQYTPIERVGIYVPGGTASYPSTVLMNALPARIAGVSEIIMVTPPNQEGKIKDEILYAASLAGVDRIFKCGGAQAIAALAYGTESVPKVDKIVGPGNIYVALAKRMVYGMVSIDMIAGPSEILIVADDTACPKRLAADLLSQAEHDKLATAVLVTDSLSLAQATQAEVERQAAQLPRNEIVRASLDNNSKIIVVEDLNKAVDMANEIAPEHLELCVNDPFALKAKIKNAGSIFLGHFTPESLGDYLAGPNHPLPTGGSARFSSPLSVDDFVKKSSYLYYPEEAFKRVAAPLAEFARAEGLAAHARAALVRFEEIGDEQ